MSRSCACARAPGCHPIHRCPAGFPSPSSLSVIANLSILQSMDSLLCRGDPDPPLHKRRGQQHDDPPEREKWDKAQEFENLESGVVIRKVPGRSTRPRHRDADEDGCDDAGEEARQQPGPGVPPYGRRTHRTIRLRRTVDWIEFFLNVTSPFGAFHKKPHPPSE